MSDEQAPSAIAAASDGASASPSEILLQPLGAQSHAEQAEAAPQLDRSVTVKDREAKFEFDWGLVLPSAAHDELGGEIAAQLADRLVEDLSDLFGPDHISHRKTGKLTKELAFIKVHGDIALLEKFACESKFRVNSDEGDEPVAFSPDAKVASALTHPGCACVEQAGKRAECARCHTTHCACCKSRHVDGAECNGGVCTCELFYPYQRSELVHSLIVEVLAGWTKWALEQRAAKAADGSDAHDLREAAKNMRPAQALTVALRWKLVLDAFPLHTLNKKETSQFYEARDEFARSVLAGLHLTGTDSSTKFVTFFREYFGEKIALYFAFLHYYNVWMIFLGSPALALAIYTWATEATDNPLVPLFCLFASIWASLFVEYWSRKSAALAHRWEMAEFEARETELQSYVEAEERQTGEATYGFFEAGGGWVDMQDYADKLKDKRLLKFVPKSHQDTPGVFPDWCCCLCGERGRRLNQIVSHFLRSFVSLAVINTMIAIVIAVVVSLIVLRIVMGSGTYGGIAAAVIQSVAIIVLDAVYLKLAIWMTDFENKRTPTLYEDSMIVKIFLFQFVNAYFSLFYIAFVKSRFNTVFGFVTGLCVDTAGAPVTVVNSDGLSVNNCMPELTTQLTSIMITRMIVGNLTKNILPFLTYKFKNWQQARANRSKLAEEHPDWSEEQVQAEVESSGLRIRDIPQVEAEYNKGIYETVPNCAGTFNDFNTLLIQYGYVVLFAPAFPLAAFLALMSNVIEDYSNGFKLLFSVRRPRYSGAADIGSWFSLFAIVSHLAVFTNAAIIVFTSTQMSRVLPGSTLFAQFAVVMAVEHVILMLKWAIARFTPEAPEWVRIRVARIDRIHSIMSEALEEEEAAKAAEEKRRLMMGGGGGARA